MITLSQAPSTYVVPVVPSDTANFNVPTSSFGVCSGFSIGIAGTITIVDASGNVVPYGTGELALGIIHPIACLRINATGTSASAIKAYFN